VIIKCVTELFQWSDVYSVQTVERLADHWRRCSATRDLTNMFRYFRYGEIELRDRFTMSVKRRAGK